LLLFQLQERVAETQEEEELHVPTMPTPPVPSSLGTKLVGDEFRRLDQNRSGTLSKQEVTDGLRARGLPCTKEVVERFFQRVDLDGDGAISEAEFSKFATERIEECRSIYKAVDENGDGKLTSAELRSAAGALGFSVSSSQLRELLGQANENEGVIPFENFCLFLLLLPAVNPQATFEALSTRYVEGSQSEYSPPAEVVTSNERKNLLAVLAKMAYSGSIAGGISRTVTAPLDRLKTLMQASPPGQKSPGLLAGLRGIYAEGGIAPFFRGNLANCIKIAPETSVFTFSKVVSIVA
jgi:solute carrier family 25 phosphate transporter 23/24/25/41